MAFLKEYPGQGCRVPLGLVDVANMPAGGALNVAIVDLYCGAVVAQTTPGQTLSAPAPSNPTRGRVFWLFHGGTAAFVIGAAPLMQKVWPTSAVPLEWNGAAWVAPKHTPYLVPITQNAAFTLDGVIHHGEILDCNFAATTTITIPNTLPVGFQCSFTQVGVGRMTFTGAGGMVVVNRWGATQSAGQWAKVGIEVRAVNSAILSGDVV